jgi:hypothetical protein
MEDLEAVKTLLRPESGKKKDAVTRLETTVCMYVHCKLAKVVDL